MRAVSQSETHFAICFSDLNVLRFFKNILAAGGVTSFAWNCDCSMLVMIREEELCVVPYPPAVPNDPALLDKFTIRQNIRYLSFIFPIHLTICGKTILRLKILKSESTASTLASKASSATKLRYNAETG